MSTEATLVPEPSIESSVSAVRWGAITAGALAAAGVSIVLMALGPAIGLSVLPWSPLRPAPTSFGFIAGTWLIVTQWLSAALGGYVAGRLREKWVGIRTDEVFFRDTAHGFLAWALATVIVVALLTIASALAAAAATADAGTVTVGAADADQVRKAAAAFSFFSALSFLIGAFIGSVAGALGGYHRDDI